MIFLTVGTQLPFDRLVRALDELAPRLQQPVFGQIGAADYRPRNFEVVARLGPDAFEQRLAESSIIVSHAGIGTVLAAQRHRKPLVLVPRRADLGEHRNDHQLATCRELAGREGIRMSDGVEDLERFLVDFKTSHSDTAPDARAQLVGYLSGYFRA